MTNSGAAVCLDLSRLVSRVGRGPWTGVDRVEAAWLDRLTHGDLTAFGMVRMRLGYALLDGAGLAALSNRLTGALPWGRPDLTARLTPGLTQPLLSAEADLRRLALATCPRPLLARMLRRYLPGGAVYLNTGHSNLTDRVLGTMAARGHRIAVLVHDLIPLTHPQFQRPGTPEAFAARMARVAARADLAIYNSAATRAEAEAAFAPWGRVPDGVVAHLGVEPPAPDPATPLPEGMPPPRPYFVCLGTIEPRKNHALLLDVWEGLGPQAPALLILGARGWANEAVFRRLDAIAASGLPVREQAGLSDAAVARLLSGAAGLLFPSRAEGFGLPALEAAAMGVPVVCTDLPAFRELLGDWPVYAGPDDAYAWAKAIADLAGRTEAERRQTGIAAPRWEDHFNLVLKRL
jgi:glycosyltransferase involved in cell wall biosynthesis